MSVEAHPEHAIRCPWCKAPTGQRCTTPHGRALSIPSHQARTDAWTKTETGGTRTGRTDTP